MSMHNHDRVFHAWIQRGDRGLDPQPPEYHKDNRFFSNTGTDPLENHKATKPLFNVGPSKWRFVGGPMMPALSVTFRLRAKKGPAPPPPLGNFADISYLEENFKPHLLRDVCTLCSGALVSDSLLHM